MIPVPALARGLPLLALALTLSACALLASGDKEPPDLYVLSPKSTFPEGLPYTDVQLLVETPSASAGLTTSRIAIKPKPTSLEYYENSEWTDVAPKVVQTLMLESFDNADKIKGIESEGSGLRVDYLLKSDLREFQAELYKGEQAVVRVRVHARLVRWSDREIIFAEQFEEKIALANDKIETIVKAFDEALGKVLKKLVTWSIRAINSYTRKNPIRRE